MLRMLQRPAPVFIIVAAALVVHCRLSNLER